MSADVKWEPSGERGIWKRIATDGKPRYRAVVRESRQQGYKQVARTFPTMREAKAWRADTSSKKRVGRRVGSSSYTLDAWFVKFMSEVDLRPSTIGLYQHRWKKYASPALGRFKLTDISKTDVSALLTRMKNEGRGAPTIAQVRRVLHRVFQYAVDLDELERNPAALPRGSTPRVERKKPVILSRDQVSRIAEETPDRYKALFWTLALTGLRISEATALRVKNLDLTSGVIHVVENSPEVGGVLYHGRPKTERGLRDVPIAPTLVSVLKDHLARFATPLDRESLVFQTAEGEQVRQSNFRQRVFQPACIRAGITPPPPVHSLRRTAASFFAASGMSIAQAALVLGHGSAQLVDLYQQLVVDEDLRSRIDAIGIALQQAP